MTLPDFDRQLTEHDLPLLFKLGDQGSAFFLQAALSKAQDLFAPYEYLLEDEGGGWIKATWDTAEYYGYRLASPPSGEPARTPLDFHQCLSCLEKPADRGIDRYTFRYLFTQMDGHWNISHRSGNGIKSVLGVDLGADPDTLQKCMNDAIADIASLPLGSGDGAAALFEHLTEKKRWRTDARDLTVLFHLVWPKIYPVWYRRTEDGYSQIPGMDKLLEAMSSALGVTREPAQFQNYAYYAAAYRLLVRLYHAFIYHDPLRPLHPPHFEYLTLLFAGLDQDREALRMLLDRKALVLYGVPGTGKTHTALKILAPAIASSDGARDRVKKVQFHPGYSYADFIIGIRPQSDGATVTYPVEPGTLYRLAAEAALEQENQPSAVPKGKDEAEIAEDSREPRFVLVIDEINRADLAKVLGEAMFQLEYRGKANWVRLPLQMPDGAPVCSVFTGQLLPRDPFSGGRAFYLPENLYLIGTMNHADRSISGFDMALRRRFAWAEHTFSASSLRQMLVERCKPEGRPELKLANVEDYVARCRRLNALIAGEEPWSAGERSLPLNRDHMIGHAYFAEIIPIVRRSVRPSQITSPHLETLWVYYLAPLLEDFLGYEAQHYREELKALRNQFIAKL